MRRFCRMLAALLAAALVCGMLPAALASGETVVAEGACGESANWKLTEDGVLTVYGSGDITEMFFIPYDCRSLVQTVVVEPGITGIGAYAFSECRNLQNTRLPEGITHIGMCAFRGAGKLTGVSIPASVTSIDVFAFALCEELETIMLPSGVDTVVFRRVYEGTMVEITLPSTVRELGYGAFVMTKAGQKVDIEKSFILPESTSVINAETFEGVNASVIAMNAVYGKPLEIGSKAFADCSQLKYFFISAPWVEELQIADDAFSGCGSGLTIVSDFYSDELAEQLAQYAADHGFQYLRDEKYWGDG